jgi:hypothetical protein
MVGEYQAVLAPRFKTLNLFPQCPPVKNKNDLIDFAKLFSLNHEATEWLSPSNHGIFTSVTGP